MQPCPRQANEAMMRSQLEHVSKWEKRSEASPHFIKHKDYDGLTCSYCGSCTAEVVFEAIEKGWKITPTDKNYKIYIDMPNPDSEEIVEIGSSSKPVEDENGKMVRNEDGSIKYDRTPMMGKAGNFYLKFYFQHFTQEEQERFIAAMNAKKINLAYPGYFYRLPFFVQPALPTRTDTAN